MVDEIESYADGSYSTSDDGGRGDIFALVPRIYGVPDYLGEYYDLAKALRVATNTCALQQGKCWVIRRDRMLPRVGQRCGRGECGWRGRNSPGLAADLAALRSGSFAGLGGVPVALATAQGLAVVQGGAVHPIWQRVYRNTDANYFGVQGPSETYSAAVRAAMVIADQTKKQRLVYRFGVDGKTVIPVVYVHPGGLVRSTDKATGSALRVDVMDNFELRQHIAASAGGSIMPFGM
jgi:hypothetical protein